MKPRRRQLELEPPPLRPRPAAPAIRVELVGPAEDDPAARARAVEALRLFLRQRRA